MFTTDGINFSAKSAKDSGAGFEKALEMLRLTMKKNAMNFLKLDINLNYLFILTKKWQTIN
tara:strand:- start:771 stop:953 length:183 start_codon:yes stop_codon:yes gene_type:complete